MLVFLLGHQRYWADTYAINTVFSSQPIFKFFHVAEFLFYVPFFSYLYIFVNYMKIHTWSKFSHSICIIQCIQCMYMS